MENDLISRIGWRSGVNAVRRLVVVNRERLTVVQFQEITSYTAFFKLQRRSKAGGIKLGDRFHVPEIHGFRMSIRWTL